MSIAIIGAATAATTIILADGPMGSTMEVVMNTMAVTVAGEMIMEFISETDCLALNATILYKTHLVVHNRVEASTSYAVKIDKS